MFDAVITLGYCQQQLYYWLGRKTRSLSFTCDQPPPQPPNHCPYPFYSNLSIKASCIPSNLKKSELSPLFKVKDSLLSENYRPLSILPSISKVFEKFFYQQLYGYFTHILSDLLSAFRKKYGCQHVLTKLIEDSKSALDKHMHVRLLLLNLSKAFDWLPHRLLLCKLHAYDVSRDACSLLHSYLSSSFQRVKISASRSDWVQMTKGIPQCSILGPMLFNIFINDLIYVVNDVCPLYNYADDNTLAFFHPDMDILRTKLEEGSNIALDWFDENHMKANISMFQSIILRPKGSISDVSFCISEHILKPIPCVKLLGVKIDDRLSFDDHISSICLRVSYQIKGLRHIMKYMTIENRISIYNAFLAHIAIEAYKCYVNENPPHIYAMLDSVDKPYNLRGGPLAEQPKLILHILDWIPSHIRPPRFGILYTPIWKRHLLFSILSNVYWNGLALFANVAAVFYATHKMFESYILKDFTSFIDAFYWLLMNCHVFSTCVFYMFRLIFTCIIPIDHFSFSRLIASG